MRIVIAADHEGFVLKELLCRLMHDAKLEVVDFGAYHIDAEDDYPNYVIPLAKAVARGVAKRRPSQRRASCNPSDTIRTQSCFQKAQLRNDDFLSLNGELRVVAKCYFDDRNWIIRHRGPMPAALPFPTETCFR